MPITKNTPKEKVIDDFVKSDDPKFSKDSVKQRVKRALGAYYGMKEEVELEEGLSMGQALRNELSKPEPGSKLDRSIKNHNRAIKLGFPKDHPHIRTTAPAGHHFDKKGLIRLGEEVELEESIYGQHLGTWEHSPSKDYKGTKVSDRKLYKDGDHYVIRADNDQDSVVGVHSSLDRAMNQLKMTHKPKLPGVRKEEIEQLDELSKDTLQSYKSQALFDLKGATSRLHAFDPALRSKNPGKDQSIARKRTKGLIKATRQLNKESIDHDEIHRQVVASLEKKGMKVLPPLSKEEQQKRAEERAKREPQPHPAAVAARLNPQPKLGSKEDHEYARTHGGRAYWGESVELGEGWNDHISKIEVHYHGTSGAGVTMHAKGKKHTEHFDTVEKAQAHARKLHAATGREAEYKDMTEEIDFDNLTINEEASNGEVLGKLSRVIGSVKTKEQHAAAKRYADLAFKHINRTNHKTKSFGAGLSDSLATLRSIRKDLSNKAREIGEEVEIDEAAKWRSTLVAKKVTDPDDESSRSYDYHHENPRSTGMKQATSDKPYSYGSLMARPEAQVASQGARKGMITKQHVARLKDRIKSAMHKEETELEEVKSHYEIMHRNGKVSRFIASTENNHAEAKNKAKGLGAKSLIQVTQYGRPIGKIGHNLLEEVELEEGTSRQHPLSGHEYHSKTNDQLHFIIKDAGEAAKAMKDHNSKAEGKYLDQQNDAATVLGFRKRAAHPKTGNLPNWYLNKYFPRAGVKEEVELTEAPMKGKIIPPSNPNHPKHAEWKASQPKKERKQSVRLGKEIDTSDPKLHKALEKHLGGSFEHFESEPKHGHNEHGHATMIAHVTHSYTHEDLGMAPEDMGDTAESYRVKVTKHPQHGYQIGHLMHRMGEEVEVQEGNTSADIGKPNAKGVIQTGAYETLKLAQQIANDDPNAMKNKKTGDNHVSLAHIMKAKVKLLNRS